MGFSDFKVNSLLISQMLENVLKSFDVFFGNIKNSTVLFLEHSHTSDAVNDFLGKEFSDDTPHVGNTIKGSLQFDFNCNEILLSCEQASVCQSLFVLTRNVGEG